MRLRRQFIDVSRGTGRGSSKKNAEESAARAALIGLRID
jgi:dsRNA-specific ribonuclease